MQCNIDQRGRVLRFVFGVLTMIAGAVVLALLSTGPIAWIAAGVLFAAGAFLLYEAARGWCALRAMGVRTPW